MYSILKCVMAFKFVTAVLMFSATTVLVLGSAIFPMPAAAATAKIGDLTKSGYSCKQIGEATHVCTRGETDPAYGCEQDDCKTVPRPTKSTLLPTLTKPLSKGVGTGKTILPADVE